MKLERSLEGKKVSIVTVNDKRFEGIVDCYIEPEDNEPEGIAAIDISDCPQSPDRYVGFNEDEIKSIENVK